MDYSLTNYLSQIYFY